MRRNGVLLILLAVLAIHALLLWVYYSPAPKVAWGDEVTYREAADRILAGEDPGLEPLWPPLYPRVVAWLLWAGGGSLLLLQFVQSALLVLVALLLRDLCTRAVGPARVGDIVALMTLCYPPLIAFAHYLWPEVLHLALMVGALWIIVARRDRTLWLVPLGLMLGLALLTKSLLGPFLPVLLLPLVVEGGWRKRILRLSLVLAMIAVAVAPAVVANYRQHGVAMIADSSRFNVWVGLNDRTLRNFREDRAAREFKRYMASAGDLQGRNEVLDRNTAALLEKRGLLGVLRGQVRRQYFRLFDKDSFLTDQLPGGILALRGRGYVETPAWAVAVIRYSSYAAYAFLLLAAAWGCALRPPGRRPWGWLLLAFLGYNLLLFLVLHVKTRYRVQILPVLFVYAAISVDSWLPGGRRDLPPAPAIAVAAVVAAVLMFLAFGAAFLEPASP